MRSPRRAAAPAARIPRGCCLALLAVLLGACRPAPEAPVIPESESPDIAAAPIGAQETPAPSPEADLPLVEVPPAPRSLQPVEEFEGREVPAGLEADAGGSLRVTTLRSNSGTRALA